MILKFCLALVFLNILHASFVTEAPEIRRRQPLHNAAERYDVDAFERSINAKKSKEALEREITKWNKCDYTVTEVLINKCQIATGINFSDMPGYGSPILVTRVSLKAFIDKCYGFIYTRNRKVYFRADTPVNNPINSKFKLIRAIWMLKLLAQTSLKEF